MALSTLNATSAGSFETKAVAQQLKELSGTPQTHGVAKGTEENR